MTTHESQDMIGSYLLLSEADSQGRPAMVEGAEHAPKAELEQTEPQYLWNDSAPANDLVQQRWGLFVPEGERGDRLLELIAPLRRRREQQQGAPAQVHRVPPELSDSGAVRWKKKYFRDPYTNELERPRYQLILGDFHEVPLSLQLAQASDGFVGRLAFDHDDDYAAYANKVVASERAGSAVGQANTLLHTVHDHTRATSVGYRELMQPSEKHILRLIHDGNFRGSAPVILGHELQPSPGDLLDAVSDPAPAVLLSLSHGEGPPRRGWTDAATRRARQGAMSFGPESLTGAQLKDAHVVPRGLWFMFACYGAGTPRTSAYHHWLTELAKHDAYTGSVARVLRSLPEPGERPFVAALPKAVLASEAGPLAFIGHVDLAWSYSFQELDEGPRAQPTKFSRVLSSAVQGDRFGIAFRRLYSARLQTESELATLYDAEASGEKLSRERLAHLWMLRNDLSAYILLGDPAAHLPIPGRWRQPSAAAPSTAVHKEKPPHESLLGLPGLGASAPPTGTTTDLSLDELEQAIAEVIFGKESNKAIAARHGLARDELGELTKAYRRGGRQALAGKHT